MKNLLVVKIFTTRMEAQIAKGFLDAQDIDSFVTADDEGGAYPFPMSPSSTGVKLYVTQKDYEKAKALLENAEENAAPS